MATSTPRKYFATPADNFNETPISSSSQQQQQARRPRTAEWYRPTENSSKNETNDRKTPTPTPPLSPLRHNRTRDWCSPSSTTPASLVTRTAKITPFEPFELEFQEAMKLRQMQSPTHSSKDKRPVSAISPSSCAKSLANSFSAARTPVRVGSAPMSKKPAVNAINFAALPQLLQPHPLLVRLESEFGLRSVDREHLEQSTKAPIGALPFQISRQIIQEDNNAATAALEAAKEIPDRVLPMRVLSEQLQQEYWSIDRSIKHAQAVRVEREPFLLENYLLCVFCDPQQPLTLRHRSFELLTHPLMLDMPIYGEAHAWCPWLNKTHGSAIRGLLLHYALQDADELIIERVCMLVALILQIDIKEQARKAWICWAETMSALVLDSAVAQRPLQPVLLDLSQPVGVLFRRGDAKPRPSGYNGLLRGEGFQQPETALGDQDSVKETTMTNVKFDEASIAFAVLRVFHDHFPTMLGYQTLTQSWFVQLVRYVLTSRLRVLRENDAIIVQCYLLDSHETPTDASDVTRMYVDVPWRPSDPQNINWFKWTTFNRLLASCAAEGTSESSSSSLPSAYSWLSRSMHAQCMDGFLNLFVPIYTSTTTASSPFNRGEQRAEVARLYLPWMKSLLQENEADEDLVMLSGLLMIHLYDLFFFDEAAAEKSKQIPKCCFDLSDPVQASLYKMVQPVVERTLQALQKRLLSLYASEVEWLQPWRNFDPNNSAVTHEERRKLQSALLEEQLRTEYDHNHAPFDMGPNASRIVRASSSRTWRPFHKHEHRRLQQLHATALKLAQLEEAVRQDMELNSTENNKVHQHRFGFDTAFDEVVQLLVVRLGLVPDADDIRSIEFDDRSLVILADHESEEEVMIEKRKKAAILKDVKLLFTLLFLAVQVAQPKWLSNNRNMIQYLVKRGAEAKQMCIRLQAMDLLSCIMLVDPSYQSLSPSAVNQIQHLESQYFLSSKELNDDSLPRALRKAVKEACAPRPAKEIAAAKSNGMAVPNFPASIAELVEEYAVPSRPVYFSYLPFVLSCARSLNFSSRRLSHGWLCTAHKNGSSSLDMPSEAFQSLWSPFVQLAVLDVEEEALRQELSVTQFRRILHNGLTTALAPANWRLILLKRLGVPPGEANHVQLESPDADQTLVDVALANPSPIILESLLKSSFSIASRVLNVHAHLIRRSVISAPMRSLQHQRYVTHKRCDMIVADPASTVLIGHGDDEPEEEEEPDDEDEGNIEDKEESRQENGSQDEIDEAEGNTKEETEVPSDDDSSKDSDAHSTSSTQESDQEEDSESDQSREVRIQKYVQEIQSDADLAFEAMQQAEEALGDECARGRWDPETAKRLSHENFKPSLTIRESSRSSSSSGDGQNNRRPASAIAAAAARGLESAQDFRGWCVFEGEKGEIEQDEWESLGDDCCPSAPLPLAVHILRLADQIIAEQEDDPVMLPGGCESLILTCASEVCAQVIVYLRWAVLHSQRLEWGDDPLREENNNRSQLESGIQTVVEVLQLTQLQRHADVAALFATLIPFLRRFVDLFISDRSGYNKQEWALSLSQACAQSPLLAAPTLTHANNRSDNYILHRLVHLALPPVIESSDHADSESEKKEIRKALERQRRRTTKQLTELLQCSALKGVEMTDPRREPISQQALRTLIQLRYNESPITIGEEPTSSSSSSLADREDWLGSPILSREAASQAMELILSTYNFNFSPKLLELLQSPSYGEALLHSSMERDSIDLDASWSDEPFSLLLTYAAALVAFHTQLPEKFDAFPPARLLCFRLLHAALCGGNFKVDSVTEENQNTPIPHPLLQWMARENRRTAIAWAADCLAFLSATDSSAEMKVIPAERLSRMLSEVASVVRERMDLGALQQLRQIAIRCGHHV